MSKLLEIRGLSKRFGSFQAVDNISFSVGRGEVVGFLGPNGAGKSTTMKMATGFLEPTAGTAVIGGYDILKTPISAKKQIGYLPEGAPAYGDMTALGFLRFVAKIRQLDKKVAATRLDHVIDQLQLQKVLHKRIETLSKGFKRRVGMAQAILHDPDLLILDEPTDGLDPNQKYEVRKLLSQLSSDKVVIISTHILEEVEAICSRAILIAGGQLVADQTPQQLLERSRHHNAVGIKVRAGEKSKVIDILKKLDQVDGVETVLEDAETAQIIAFPKPEADLLPAVKKAIKEEEIASEEVFTERGRLDDVFRDLTKAA